MREAKEHFAEEEPGVDWTGLDWTELGAMGKFFSSQTACCYAWGFVGGKEPTMPGVVEWFGFIIQSSSQKDCGDLKHVCLHAFPTIGPMT